MNQSGDKTGQPRPAREDHPQYVGYRCSRKNGSVKCKNSEIKREALELFVLDKLAYHLFSDEMSARIYKGHATQFLIRMTNVKKELNTVRKEISTLSVEIEKVVDLMIQTNSAAMNDRLETMEDRREQLKDYEAELSGQAKVVLYAKSVYTNAFRAAKKQLAEGKLRQTKEIIDTFVDVITVYKDRIVITFNLGGIDRKVFTHFHIRKPQARPTRGKGNVAVSSGRGINFNKIDTILGGEGSPSNVANKLTVTCSGICIQLNRQNLSQAESRWVGMREFLAALV